MTHGDVQMLKFDQQLRAALDEGVAIYDAAVCRMHPQARHRVERDSREWMGQYDRGPRAWRRPVELIEDVSLPWSSWRLELADGTVIFSGVL